MIVEPSDPHGRLGRLGVLRDVGQSLGDDEVGGAFDRRGIALRADVDGHVDRGAIREGLDRLPEAALGEDEGMDPECKIAQLGKCCQRLF